MMVNGTARLANGIVPDATGSDVTTRSASSTSTATPPSRRKSVRVSLKPTFSPTPPALADYEDDHSPWQEPSVKESQERRTSTVSSGWNTRVQENPSIWDNSDDDDDEVYSRVRQMYHKASKKLEKASHRK